MSIQEAPISKDVTDIQFKLNSKYHLIDVNAANSEHSGINLLATASVWGLVIIGNPSAPELQIIQLKDIAEKNSEASVPRRSLPLSSIPNYMALSCDHSMLTVSYTLNGSTFIDIYSVPSFLSNNVICLQQKVRVSNENYVKVKQILWNPVMVEMMAICLDDGTVGMYVIKQNSFEYFSIDKSEQARCVSWSPKGKQIVVAFPNGKLAQYKPDLKLAKTIPCTAALFSSSYEPIAIQWLSTFQFAVVFLEMKPDACPALLIINVPKNAPATYINYDDICYSQTEPRNAQIFLMHIAQWNLLLMASANASEIGILGTTETGETPTWTQYIFLDESRAECPLTSDKQDTYPIGFSLETGSTTQLMIGENKIPVMPMVHIYSTHGYLLSFNLLNLQSSYVDICSPPRPISDRSGVHLFIENSAANKTPAQTLPAAHPSIQSKPQEVSKVPSNDNANLTFVIPENSTSTPAKQTFGLSAPQKNLFGSMNQPPSSATSLFGHKPASTFGSNTNVQTNPTTFSAPTFGIASTTPANTIAPKPAPIQPIQKSEPPKPIVTVDPNYIPSISKSQSVNSVVKSNSVLKVDNEAALLSEMIRDELLSLEDLVKKSLDRSKKLNLEVCSKDEMSTLMRNVHKLQEVTNQAVESTESLSSEVQSLRLTLYEAFAMSAEVQSKIDWLNKKINSPEDNLPSLNGAHQRQLNRLETLLDQNRAAFNAISQQVDAQWSRHLEKIREKNKAYMHIPTLENVYQTLAKQHQVLQQEKDKIRKIKNKIGIYDRDDASQSKIKYNFSNIDSSKLNTLIDSVLSMTISEQIIKERKPLNREKFSQLKQLLINRPIVTVKSSRTERKLINSEVIIEKKLALARERKIKEITLEKPKTKAPIPSTQSISKAPVTTSAPIKILPNQNVVQSAPKSEQIVEKKTVLPNSPKSTNISQVASVKPTQTTANTVPRPTFGFQNTGTLSFGASMPTTEVSKSAEIVKPTISFGSNSGTSSLSFLPNTTITPISKTESPIITVKATKETKQVQKENILSTPVPQTMEAPKTVFGQNQALSLTTKPPNNVESNPLVAKSPAPLTIFGQSANASNLFAKSASTTITPKPISESSPTVVGLLKGTTPATISPVISTPSTKFSAANPIAIVSAPKPITSDTASSFSFSLAGLPSSTSITSIPLSVTNNAPPPAESLFTSLNVCKPNTVEPTGTNIFTNKAFANAAAATTTPVASIFSTSVSSSTKLAVTTASVFGNAAITSPTISETSKQNTIFGNVVTATTTPQSNAGSIFGSMAISSTAASPSSGSNIFGGSGGSIGFGNFSLGGSAKPDATIFGSPSANKEQNPFSFATPGNSLNANNAGGSVFGNASVNTNASVFGTPQAASASTLFGQNANTAQQNTPTGGSIFGNSSVFNDANKAQPQQSGGSIFGSGFGGGFAQASSNAPAFGSSATFSGNQSGGVFGSQMASSPIAQTGFNSPPSNPFGGMGGATTGSSAPIFGQQASFGGAATFGSSKGAFGTMGNANPAFGAPPQKNTLFESLGASDSGMTFGNLAQNQNTPPAQKPFTQSSSFSSWR